MSPDKPEERNHRICYGDGRLIQTVGMTYIHVYRGTKKEFKLRTLKIEAVSKHFRPDIEGVPAQKASPVYYSLLSVYFSGSIVLIRDAHK